ncbi:MAG: NADP-dependent isocitrate dehydrogenase [Clostridia bacterium]|nr:NADP-dependent isocitrate dehydrogenase [Clostridia bacterium]MBQ4619037.1 NADP-dependent isocitrate dehydrogenase [Clostridia bacterium]
MTKIRMNPIAELDGDEMTRILWRQIKEIVLAPYVDLNTEYYDLGLKKRDETDDAVTLEAAKAIKRLKVGVKCATITPNTARMTEYNLKRMYKSPNGTIRAYLDGTVFRTPIMAPGITPVIPTWTKPITVARHAYGDVYRAVEMKTQGKGKAEIVYTSEDGCETRLPIFDFDEDGIIQGMHNRLSSIESFARACFEYALSVNENLWFSAKDTISKVYDETFKQVFEKLYEAEYREKFEKRNLTYFYTLIDDAVARAVRSKGGFVWAMKNYDGDVLSDMISAAFGSLALMSSVLVSPDGCFEYEAAHGTVTRHYYRYLNGEKTSTNPMATLYAWTGALYKRGEIDQNTQLMDFSKKAEDAAMKTIRDGIVTGDMALLMKVKAEAVDSEAFLTEIAKRIRM